MVIFGKYSFLYELQFSNYAPFPKLFIFTYIKENMSVLYVTYRDEFPSCSHTEYIIRRRKPFSFISISYHDITSRYVGSVTFYLKTKIKFETICIFAENVKNVREIYVSKCFSQSKLKKTSPYMPIFKMELK